jgi:DNA polymerase
LWRLVHESRELLESGDPDVARLLAMETVVGEGREVIGAGPFVPSVEGAGLGDLVTAAARCTGCDLYRRASRTVFGKGPADARVVLVGEQPGDQEDRQGAPFVGPAGEVFDRALVEVGLARERLYVTNAVKHFKFVPRGKRRIHQTPAAADIAACRPWVEAELTLVKPEILVCLGATASRALLGSAFRLMRDRGRFIDSPWARKTIATLHPSAVLRGEDEAAQGRLYAMLRDDLRLVSRSLSG